MVAIFEDSIFKFISVISVFWPQFYCNIFQVLYNYQYAIFASDNGLAPIKRQAIIKTNDGLVYWRTFSLDEYIENDRNSLQQVDVNGIYKQKWWA